MGSSTYIVFLLLFIALLLLRRRRQAVIARKLIKKRKMEGNFAMKELAKQFIGKECVVYAFDSNHQFDGVIRKVTDGAILLEKENGKQEAINLDFVIRIREYPRNKKGQKKAAVWD